MYESVNLARLESANAHREPPVRKAHQTTMRGIANAVLVARTTLPTSAVCPR